MDVRRSLTDLLPFSSRSAGWVADDRRREVGANEVDRRVSSSPVGSASTTALDDLKDLCAYPDESICERCRRINFKRAFVSPRKEWVPLTVVDTGLCIANLGVPRTRFRPADCPLCCLLLETLELTVGGGEESFRLWALSFPFTSLGLYKAVWSFDGSFPYLRGRDVFSLVAIPSSWEASVDKNPNNLNTPWIEKARSEGTLVLSRADSATEAGKPRRVKDEFDAELVRSWIQICRDNHSAECLVPPEAKDLRLIDCETLRVVPAPSAAPYVALSYVWSPSTRISLYAELHSDESGHFLPANLPLVTSHAVKVTTQLGYRYLWIDKYCIDQGDPEDLRKQIGRMGLIFRGADLTIVAAAGENEEYGLPGVGSTPRVGQGVFELGEYELVNSLPIPVKSTAGARWNTRAWTLQEGLLSRRRLIFTDRQTYFECRKMHCCESIGGPELLTESDSLARYSVATKTGLFSSFSTFANPLFADIEGTAKKKFPFQQNSMLEYMDCVSAYTDRNLSFDSDSLRAFLGISLAFEKAEYPILNVSGISYMPYDAASSVKRPEVHLAVGLSWFHPASSPARRRAQFPSWTWAGWAGRVTWKFLALFRDQLPLVYSNNKPILQCESHLKNIAFGFENGDRVSLASTVISVEKYYAASSRPQTAAEPTAEVGIDYEAEEPGVTSRMMTVCALTFDGIVFSPALFSFSETDQFLGQVYLANFPLVTKGRSLPCTPRTLWQRLCSGKYACILLSSVINLFGRGPKWHTEILLLEWQDAEKASRVGLVSVIHDESLSVFVEKHKLQRRRVCVV